MKNFYNKTYIMSIFLTVPISLFGMEPVFKKKSTFKITTAPQVKKTSNKKIAAQEQEAAILDYINKNLQQIYNESLSLQETAIIIDANNNLKDAYKKLEKAEASHRKTILTDNDYTGTRCPSCTII